MSQTATHTPTEHAPALKRFSDAVRAHFGDRLERIVLYGSCARGDARPDSDYDVAIFVRELGNRWQELETIAPVTMAILAEQDELINPLIFSSRALAKPFIAADARDPQGRRRPLKSATNDYLQAAGRALDKGRIVHGVGLFDEAGRYAYYAMFHAAQATILERTDRIAKPHKGVNRQFHLICMSEPRLGTELSSGLSRAYQFKEMADYDVGTVPPVSLEEATAALDTAKQFVARVRHVIEAGDQTAP